MRFVFLFLGLLSQLLLAQPKAQPRTCRILFLDRPESISKTAYLYDGSASQKIELPRHNLSEVYKIPSGTVNLVLLDQPLADPTQIPASAPRVSLPENGSDFYLIMIHDPSEGQNPVKMRLIPSDQGSPKGQMTWFNFTHLNIEGVVGKTKLNLKPGSKLNLPAPATSKDDFLVELGHRLPNDEFLYPICRNQWIYNHESKALVFIYHRQKQRSPVIQMFTDFRLE